MAGDGVGADEVDVDSICGILRAFRRVAVVGLSPDPTRPSNEVARYLVEHGYYVVPVNPSVDAVMGTPAAATLAEARERGPLEIVDVFRHIDAVPQIVDEAIALGARVVWLQLGLVDEPAAAKARAAGIEVVQDRCIKIEHARCVGGRGEGVRG